MTSRSWFMRDAVDNVRTRPMSVALSLLAIAIGMMSLSVLLCILAGLEQRAAGMVQELGGDVCAILQSSSVAPGQAIIEARHQERLAQGIPGALVSSMTYHEVENPYEEGELGLMATDDRMALVRSWRLGEGRNLDPVDVKERGAICLVSEGLRDRYNLSVGQVIPLAGAFLEIVGVLQTPRVTDQVELDSALLRYRRDLLVVPSSLIPYWSRHRQDETGRIDGLFVRSTEGESADLVATQARRLLAAEPALLKTLMFVTPESLVRTVRRMQRTVQLTSGSVSLLCLVLGGTTLMSLMIANVRERVTEIGLRLALGAAERDIALLFLGEGLVTTGVASAIGVGGAYTLLWLGRERIAVPFHLGIEGVIVPLMAAILVGMVSSYIPARIASRISPSEALRFE